MSSPTFRLKRMAQRLVDKTIEQFGGFDSWVNNAGIGVYAQVLDLEMVITAIFDTNYWGVVYGSVIAARYFKDTLKRGALINVGLINSDMPGPILASYNAPKHAVKGFTDLISDRAANDGEPVFITLIQPSAIGTPGSMPATPQAKTRLPEPVYAPKWWPARYSTPPNIHAGT